MARTASTMLQLGTPAADFSLPDVVSGRIICLATFKADAALLVMFICSSAATVRSSSTCNTSWRALAPSIRDGRRGSWRSARTMPGSTRVTRRIALRRWLSNWVSVFHSAATRLRMSQRRTPRRVRRTSSSSMTRGDWCTEASWTTAGQGTGTLSRVPIFVRRSTRCWQADPSAAIRRQAWDATSSGGKATNRSLSAGEAQEPDSSARVGPQTVSTCCASNSQEGFLDRHRALSWKRSASRSPGRRSP